MCERRRSSGCPHSLLRRSSADLPWRSGCRAQGTARGRGSRRRRTGRKSKWRRERSSERERAMNMTVDDYECTQNLSVRCAVSSSSVEQWALSARSTHDVHHAIVEVNVVIGVLVVHCELLVVRVVPLVVCDDAVIRRTFVLIAFIVAFVFVVAIFHRILLYWRYLFTPPVGDSELRWAVTEFWTVVLHQINSDNHTSNNWPNHRPSGFSDQSMLGPSSRWCSNEECHKIFASSTKMKKSFATFGNRLYLLGAWAVARLTMLAWSQLDALLASYRNQLCSNGATNCCGTH